MPEINKPKDKTYRAQIKPKKKPEVLWAYGAISKEKKRFDKEKGRRVACLKCDKVFLGRINVRICDACKKKEDYHHGSAYANLTMAQLC